MVAQETDIGLREQNFLKRLCKFVQETITGKRGACALEISHMAFSGSTDSLLEM
jgi:hypothetical protein